jgi:hypothetical protein
MWRSGGRTRRSDLTLAPELSLPNHEVAKEIVLELFVPWIVAFLSGVASANLRKQELAPRTIAVDRKPFGRGVPPASVAERFNVRAVFATWGRRVELGGDHGNVTAKELDFDIAARCLNMK